MDKYQGWKKGWGGISSNSKPGLSENKIFTCSSILKIGGDIVKNVEKMSEWFNKKASKNMHKWKIE